MVVYKFNKINNVIMKFLNWTHDCLDAILRKDREQVFFTSRRSYISYNE